MPTGYTAKLHEGEQSLREFLMGIGRGMGFAITQRDDDIGEPVREVEPSDYHDRQIAEYESKLASLRDVTDEEALSLAREEYRDTLRRHEEAVAKRRALVERYARMLHEVAAWDPPELVAGVKELALEQLQESIKFDCGVGIYPDKPEEPTSGAEWLAARRAEARKSLAYHEKARAEEIARTNDRNRYIRTFLDSLPDADPVAGGS